MKTPVKIRVDLSTREDLKALGRKGESYDDVIRRLMEKPDYIDWRKTKPETGELLDLEEEVKE